MSDALCGLHLVGKLHRLYVAAPMHELEAMVSSCFEGFTIYEEAGHFRGTRERMVVIEIATNDTESVVNLCRNLRAHFKQDGIGLAMDGFYFRVTA